MRRLILGSVLFSLSLLLGLSACSDEKQMTPVASDAQTMQANPCNPCAGAMNPCNPCMGQMNPCNPCAGAALDSSLVSKPAGVQLYSANRADLVREGEQAWNDASLSTNGVKCADCHQNNMQFQSTFTEAYPHTVAMATQRAGLGPIDAAEMVQLCLVVPMQADPLPWESRKLAALAAYVDDVKQPEFAAWAAANPDAVKTGMNPCNPCAGMMNPCNPDAGMMNPCNPCAGMMNPCNPDAGMMNPCNPCAGMMNPCNPDAGMMNPCNPEAGMMNPCNPDAGMMNPCNPCGM